LVASSLILENSSGTTHYAIAVVAVLLSLFLIRIVTGSSEDAPIRYTVPRPKLPEGKQIVEQTSVKV
jgi:uncharacterized membrane protein (UPF0136 family)